MKLVFSYAAFAGVAMVVNFATQYLIDALWMGDYKVWLALIGGTGTGLLVKYFLDKRFIFRFQTKSVGQDLKLGAGYAFFGLVTTAVFWGSELGFDALFHSSTMRYVGGAIGLTVGYYLKYQLDKKFVFREVRIG